MKKIVFGITGLTLGGAERVLVDLVNELSNKYDITIFTLYGKGELERELSDKVKLVRINEKSFNELTRLGQIINSFKILFNKKSIYKKYIKDKYDIEIAFLEGPITRLFSPKNKSVNKIVWVHNDISQVFGKGLKAKIKLFLDKMSYKNYNNIIFVSDDNKKQFESKYKLKNNKLVIQNYISSKRVQEKANDKIENVFSEEKINFLTISRLVKQKGIERLVKVHSQLIKKGYIHNFYVIGDGPENKKITELIKLYNVEDTFKLLGKIVNPYPYIKQSDIFALLSYYEGFPMTLLEAKILNKPIVITNTAAREVVKGYKKSYIVDNTEYGIFEGIKYGMENLMKNNDVQDYIDNYEIIKKIEKLVE